MLFPKTKVLTCNLLFIIAFGLPWPQRFDLNVISSSVLTAVEATKMGLRWCTPVSYTPSLIWRYCASHVVGGIKL
ncbi:hypothetical protein HDV62DRAFT_369049 [Trichoderma sp. SZMC 28011]